MMGVGKSTIGKASLKKLSIGFLILIELLDKEGVSINRIFKNKSENYFRKLENNISLKKLDEQNCVISLGGGAFLNRSIRRAVKNNAVSFG